MTIFYDYATFNSFLFTLPLESTANRNIAIDTLSKIFLFSIRTVLIQVWVLSFTPYHNMILFTPTQTRYVCIKISIDW